MAIVPIPNIRDLGIVPNNNMDEAEYNTAAEAFTGNMPGWGADNKAVGDAGRTNALHAQGAADSATTSATTANQRANDAAASANTASTKASDAAAAANAAAASYASMQKLYLGPKSAPPTTDNQGQPLQLGAWYTNTTNGYWYWWNGANWIVGVGDLNSVDWNTQIINKPSLVNTVNGRSGTVTGVVDAAATSLGTAAMSTAPLGQWATFNSTGTAGSDWPTTLGTAWWNVITIGTATRKTQRAVQVLAGAQQGWTFERCLQDTTWGPWMRVFTDITLIEKMVVNNSVSGTYTADPAIASIHHIAMTGNTAMAIPAPRSMGDQVMVRVYQAASHSLTWSGTITWPKGYTQPSLAPGEHLTVSFLTQANTTSWFAYPGGIH